MKHSVLFVCFGNTCRSPMATAIFRELVSKNQVSDQWDVKSCGTNARVGDPVSRHAQTCMKQHDVYRHIQDDKSQMITKEDVKNFEFILVMDANNLRSLSAACKEGESQKIQLLGKYDSLTKDGVIIDPYGQNQEVYEKTFQQIQRSCEAFFKSIEN